MLGYGRRGVFHWWRVESSYSYREWDGEREKVTGGISLVES